MNSLELSNCKLFVTLWKRFQIFDQKSVKNFFVEIYGFWYEILCIKPCIRHFMSVNMTIQEFIRDRGICHSSSCQEEHVAFCSPSPSLSLFLPRALGIARDWHDSLIELTKKGKKRGKIENNGLIF